MNLLDVISYAGIFVFAVTGALKARTHHMDVFGATVLAFVTAYGGGTTRDLLIGIRPVNWVNDYLAMSLVVSAVIIVACVNKSFRRFKRAIFITDAIGLGLFTGVGIQVSLMHDLNNTYAVVMGMITGTFGGLIADIISNTVPDLLKRGELYATASLAGGVIYILMQNLNAPDNAALLSCVVIIVAVRIVSKLKRLMLPEI
jgi:uncharacterized membrane protein YeiH